MYSFPSLEPVIVPCPVLTVVSWPAYRFLKSQVSYIVILISLSIVHNLMWSTQSNAVVCQQSRSICFFLHFSCFFYEPTNVGNWISCPSAFSQCSLNICMFLVYVLLKLILENFQHYFCCLGDGPITIIISNKVPSHISLDLCYLIAKLTEVLWCNVYFPLKWY